MLYSGYDSPFQTALRIGTSKGLKLFDPVNNKITLQSPEWKSVFELVIDTYQSVVIYQRTEKDRPEIGMRHLEVLQTDPFIAKKVAMAVATDSFATDIKTAFEQDPEKMTSWDIVSFPANDHQIVNDEAMWIQYMTAIHAQSANVPAAWEVVKYINSDEFTRVALKSTLHGKLPVRRQLLPDDGYHADAFYQSGRGPYVPPKNAGLSNDAYTSFLSAADKQMLAVLQGELALDSALSAIEQAGGDMFQNME